VTDDSDLVQDFSEDSEFGQLDQIEPRHVRDPPGRLRRHGIQIQRSAACRPTHTTTTSTLVNKVKEKLNDDDDAAFA